MLDMVCIIRNYTAYCTPADLVSDRCYVTVFKKRDHLFKINTPSQHHSLGTAEYEPPRRSRTVSAAFEALQRIRLEYCAVHTIRSHHSQCPHSLTLLSLWIQLTRSVPLVTMSGVS